jgi:zinc D-Ala-D-Ala carboxypeptidase
MIYFTIKELIRSKTAEARGIDNTPPDKAKACLANLINKVLNPLRASYGKPITVTSGYRCPRLNALVGGVSTSQHLLGQAADISGGSRSENARLFELIKQMGLPVDQCIDEHNFEWVHVSYSSRNRRQFFAK